MLQGIPGQTTQIVDSTTIIDESDKSFFEELVLIIRVGENASCELGMDLGLEEFIRAAERK